MCLTEEFGPVAAAFAAATSRDPVTGWADPAWPEAAGTRVATVLGRVDAFPIAELNRVAGALTAPWRLLPALDVAGLSFVAAKSLLGPPASADGEVAAWAVPRTAWRVTALAGSRSPLAWSSGARRTCPAVPSSLTPNPPREPPSCARRARGSLLRGKRYLRVAR